MSEVRTHTPAELAKRVKQQMVAMPNTKEDGYSPIYRNSLTSNELLHDLPGAKTLHEVFEHGMKQAGPNADFLGERKKLPNGSWSPYIYQTWSQIATRRKNLGSGMRSLHIELGNDDSKPFAVGIYAINRPEWLITEYACHMHSLVVVAMFDTFGPDAIAYVINHSEMEMVACTADKVGNLMKVKPSCGLLKAVIVMDSVDPAVWEKLKAEADGIELKLVGLVELEQVGSENPIEPRLPTDETVTTICYTSGTTGTPKGAMLTHKNLLSAAAGVNIIGVTLTPQDVHVSYLPYAHVFERAVTCAVVWGGSKIAFFRGDVTLLFEDIGLIRPTLFVSVPPILAKTVDSGSFVVATMFKRGLEAKLRAQEQGSLTNTFWDALVFNKIKALLGGRVKYIISGSAPLSASVIQFLRAAFTCDVIEGYGTTETAAGASMTWMGDYTSAGTIGPVLSNCEIRLKDIPEMSYLSSDKPEPRGEICLRGPNIFKGYFKDPEKTKETMDDDGWLYTGDVGKIDKYNRIIIIDRKKNMFKLAQGEYVAPEKLEGVYGHQEGALQVYIHGDSLQSELVAVMILDPEPAVKRAIRLGILPANTPIPGPIAPGQSIPQLLIDLCANAQYKAGILEDMQKLGKSKKLAGFEIPRALHLDADPMTIENGLLTPTMKVKRNVAQEKYKAQIDAMYAAINAKKSSKTEAAKL
ncbi:Long chain acyl-CoA synthetase 7 peroxisomal [Blyttiomyces sp. JEL0837]|nr:Long chain acyl-CoA synthetase 7 peroxisomal [Blyttiomyces sp. JEL0837]